MANRACPSCSEIIPAEVDYCPFCGNSTREGMDLDKPIGEDPSRLPEDLSVAVSNAQHRQCPNCRQVIPADVNYCPFCGNSTHEVVRQDPLEEAVDAAVRAPITNTAYICLMCHLEPATNGDYCQTCRDRLDQRPDEWEAKKVQSTKTLLIVASVVVVLLIAVAIAFTHAHR